MSFSNQVKNELAKGCFAGSTCCNFAELYGILMNCATFSCEKIRISVENPLIAKKTEYLFSKVFGIEPQIQKIKTPQKEKTILSVTSRHELREIFDCFGYEFKNIALHINFALLENRCCKAAFLRGAFLMSGAVSDPSVKYYLELSGRHFNMSNETVSLMHELGFSPKFTQRRNNYVVYLKDSVSIEDFLTCIGAGVSAMSVMQIKIEKELRNDINRRTNCDEANISKSVAAAAKQIEAINKLKSENLFDQLSDELKQTADIRLANPEFTLSELLPLFDPPISRPGLSHRLNKLIRLASKESTKTENSK